MFPRFPVLLGVCLMAAPLAAQPMPDENPTSEKRYSLDLELELRSQHDQRDRPQRRSLQGVHELSLLGEYLFDEQVKVNLDLTIEQTSDNPAGQTGDHQFLIKQAFIDWRPFQPYLQLRGGQLVLPVGFLNERDDLFSSNPGYLQRLLSSEDWVSDTGALITLAASDQRWLYLEAGVFSGQVVRPSDERAASPDSAPTILSLKSESKWHHAFASHLKHDLAFFDPVEAWGIGTELLAPEEWIIKPAFFFEYWDIEQSQVMGPDQHSQALMIFAELAWWRLKAGHRWSQTESYVVSALGKTGLPTEFSRLYFASLSLVPEVELRVERVQDTQSEILRDEWVGRALVHFSLP